MCECVWWRRDERVSMGSERMREIDRNRGYTN